MVSAGRSVEEALALHRAYRKEETIVTTHPSHEIVRDYGEECVRCAYGEYDTPERLAEPCPVTPAQEVAFLRHFYESAGDAFGPADDDIYRMIADDFDGTVPRAYDRGRHDEVEA